MYYFTDLLLDGLPVYDIKQGSRAIVWDGIAPRPLKGISHPGQDRIYIPYVEPKIETQSPWEAAMYFKTEIEQSVRAISCAADSILEINQVLFVLRAFPTRQGNEWSMLYGLVGRASDWYLWGEPERFQLGNVGRIPKTMKRGVEKRIAKALFPEFFTPDKSF